MKDCRGGGGRYRDSVTLYCDVIELSDVQMCSHGITCNGIGMYRDGMARQDRNETLPNTLTVCGRLSILCGTVRLPASMALFCHDIELYSDSIAFYYDGLSLYCVGILCHGTVTVPPIAW